MTNDAPAESPPPHATAPVGSASPRRRARPATRLLRWASLVAALLAVKTFVIDSYAVRERSMWPALENDADHVVVDKTAALRGAVARWDLVVFRRDGKHLVKRALSTGGERLAARAGDLFVRRSDDDATERVPRPREVAEAMRVPVFPHDDRRGAAGLTVDAGGAVRDDGVGGLEFDPDGGVLRAHLRAPAGGDDGAVRDDYVGADGLLRRGRNAVSDVRVSVERLTLAPGASFTVAHQLRRESRVARFEKNEVRIEVVEEGTPARTAFFQGARPEAFRVETLDGVSKVEIKDGGSWKELWSEPRRTEEFYGSSTLRFVVEGGVATVGELVVSRDAHYVDADGRDSAPGGWSVPAGELFLVGDNVPVSTDSRVFGTVPSHEVTGRVVGVWRPPAWARRRRRRGRAPS
jgi:signal peptidase I